MVMYVYKNHLYGGKKKKKHKGSTSLAVRVTNCLNPPSPLHS